MEAELTERSIMIRTYRDSDAASLYEAVRESIPEVSKWLPWCHEDYSIEESRELVAAVDNVGSQRVAEKAGATREGILRNRLLINGRPHDAVLYSLVRGDL